MGDWTYNEQKTKQASKPEYWWRTKYREKAVHECVFDTVRWIDTNQAHKAEDNLRRVRLYGNLPIFGLSPASFSVTDSRKNGRVRINVIRSVIDTAVAHIAGERPRPSAMTDGANYRLQKHARQLSKFVLGVFHANRVYDKGPVVFRDGCLTGTGAFKAWIDWKRKCIKIDRVFIDEIIFDDAEAVNGVPRQIHVRMFIAREVALEMWGRNEKGRPNEHYRKIATAPSPKPAAGIAAHKNLADHIEVIESIHLPSGPDADDGRHAICIENDTLVDEEYEDEDYNLIFFTYGEPIYGLLGMGIADLITGVQVSLNKHMDAMEEELAIASARILVPSDGEIPKSHWVNRIGAVLTYEAGSAPPTVLNPDMIPPGRREQIQFLIQHAYELAGVNQLSATGHKPAGLNSGASLREYEDIQSRRFVVVQRAYEETFVRLARLVIRLAQQLYTKCKDLEVKVPHKRFIEKIRFDEIDIDDHQYEMSIWPTSMLPKTPAARYAQIDEWVQAGYLTKEEGMRLMDMPDLEDASSLITAAMDDIDETIDRFIYHDPSKEELAGAALPEDKDSEEYHQAVADIIYVPPEPHQALAYGMKRMNAAYLRSKHDGTPEARRMLLDQWMQDAKALLDSTQPPAQPAMAAGAAPPGSPQAGMPPQVMPPPGAPPPAMPAA